MASLFLISEKSWTLGSGISRQAAQQVTGGVSSLGLTSEAWDLVMEKDPHHPNHSRLPSGKHTESYGKSPYFIGKSNIYISQFSIVMLNYQRISIMVIIMLLTSFCTCWSFRSRSFRFLEQHEVWDTKPHQWLFTTTKLNPHRCDTWPTWVMDFPGLVQFRHNNCASQLGQSHWWL